MASDLTRLGAQFWVPYFMGPLFGKFPRERFKNRGALTPAAAGLNAAVSHGRIGPGGPRWMHVRF